MLSLDAQHRLELMKHIQHPEEYYQQALKSQGKDYTALTHLEIATFKATCKALEADIMMEIAEKLPKAASIDEMDISKIA